MATFPPTVDDVLGRTLVVLGVANSVDVSTTGVGLISKLFTVGNIAYPATGLKNAFVSFVVANLGPVSVIGGTQPPSSLAGPWPAGLTFAIGSTSGSFTDWSGVLIDPVNAFPSIYPVVVPVYNNNGVGGQKCGTYARGTDFLVQVTASVSAAPLWASFAAIGWAA